MASYIMAMSINPHAKDSLPDLQVQLDDSIDAFSRAGIKKINLYATLGRFDLLAVFEADDQTVAFRIASDINGKGVLETETWPVIPYEDFSKLLG